MYNQTTLRSIYQQIYIRSNYIYQTRQQIVHNVNDKYQYQWLYITYQHYALFSIDPLLPKGRVLAVSQMQKLILPSIFFIDITKRLLSVKERIPCEKVDSFSMVELQLLFYYHNQLKYCEALQNQYSNSDYPYLLLSNYFSLLCFTRLSRIGILSGWNLRIIYAYSLRFEPYISIILNTHKNIKIIFRAYTCLFLFVCLLQNLHSQAKHFDCANQFSILFKMKNENSNHQLRFSIDLRSIKEQQFTAQLSLRYAPIPALGLTSFRSPSIPIPNPRVQTTLKDCFLSGYFQASSAQISTKLTQKIQIELWHCDRLKKDTLLGKATLEPQKVLEMPLRTTSESYARVLDAYLPVDEVDEYGKPLKTIGSLRIIAYLQDLGPADQLQQRGFNIKQLLDDIPEQENLHPRNQQYQKPNIQNAGLNELERKVVWQLETWKKAEQTKARITLKHKQIQFWTNLSEQQRKGDLEKEKQFKKIQANLTLLEGKLRSKLAELSKRQQKIMLLEQELQTKIGQVSRECLLKDQQIQTVKRRNKQDKNAVIKEKSAVQIECAKLRAQNARLRVEIEQVRKQDEKSPLNILKAQLNARILQIKELSRQVQKANEVKQQYKIYYGKMKQEVISLRQKLKNTEQSIHELRREKDIILNNCRHLEQQLTYQRQLYKQQQHKAQRQQQQDQWGANEAGLNEREMLVKRREQLIRQAHYSPSDPLIMAIDQQIRSLS